MSRSRYISLLAAVFFLFGIITLSGCGNSSIAEETSISQPAKHGNEQNQSIESGASRPSGYDDGQIQFIFIFYDGTLYSPTYKDADCISNGTEYIKQHGLTLYGKTVSENNDAFPEEELAASRLPVGTEVYIGSEQDAIYVMREDGMLLICRPYEVDTNQK